MVHKLINVPMSKDNFKEKENVIKKLGCKPIITEKNYHEKLKKKNEKPPNQTEEN